MENRAIGSSGVEVAAMGFGTWALGGPFWAGDQALGWGPTDDAESVRALRRAVELGVTLFDTSDAYGTGHAEELLGETFEQTRDQVVFATKWGNVIDSEARQLTGADHTPAYLRGALAASLKRLRTDYVDIYQLHLSDLEVSLAEELRGTAEELVAEGLIRGYGWSTDDPERAAFFGAGEHCTVVQAEANVLNDRPEMYAVAEEHDLALLCRGPLAMGLLSQRDWSTITLADDDVRLKQPEWLSYFADGKPVPSFAAERDAIVDVLTSGGRTLTQGALAWLWARSPRTIPIPGCRTVAQVEQNAGALAHGPLSESELAQVEQILGRA
jgi:aryl-alcohol dehydrogenase-like predicted oxidoreductase